MAIQIEKAFTIDAPADAVWAFLTDPYRVAGCLPGASITEQIDDMTYSGKMTVKVGPVATSYKGKISFDRLDADRKVAEISGRGQDVSGRGGADMRMTSQVRDSEAGTAVTVQSEVNVTGILAQFGRGMIVDVSDQLFQTFTDRMRAELSASGTDRQVPAALEGDSTKAAPEDEALDVVALGAKASSRALLRVLRRPGFWVVVGLGVLVAYLIFR